MADTKLYDVLGVNKHASDGEIKKVTIKYCDNGKVYYLYHIGCVYSIDKMP